MTPVELVLKIASATEGAGENPPNSNSGPFVERCLKVTGLGPGHPWCAAFTTMVGVTALGEQWPVLKSASVQQQAEWAERAKCRLVAVKAPALPGDLFCLWYPKLGRWAHVGFVVSVAKDGKTITSIEGNTSGSGSREGWMVARKTRVLTTKDRLIRWTEVIK